jgi:hypothetical protein
MPRSEPTDLTLNYRMTFTPDEIEVLDDIMAELEGGIRVKTANRFPGIPIADMIAFVNDTRRVISESKAQAQEAFDAVKNFG